MQSSPALRNGRMLIVAVASFLLVELYGEVASLYEHVSYHSLDSCPYEQDVRFVYLPRWSSHRDVQPLGHRDL
jgi:hypothetical protein